ncbi:MAG: hypothetical protein WC052_00395 [Patescibacteria group bacterium]
MTKRIGFIGQGFVGKAYADNFAARGYDIVRYSLEPAFIENREAIATCDIVFIAVPTPTTPQGFDDSALVAALPLVRDGAVLVIKSTILPETTDKLQALRPGVAIIHAPEFLRALYAAEEVANPARHIIGVTEISRPHAEEVIAILPPAPYVKIMDARAAALVKYGGNVYRYLKILFANSLYELCQHYEVSYDDVREALVADPNIESSFTDVIHDDGRGVGGHCLIKDFAAYRRALEASDCPPELLTYLKAAEALNAKLLKDSGKSLNFLSATYDSKN